MHELEEKLTDRLLELMVRADSLEANGQGELARIVHTKVDECRGLIARIQSGRAFTTVAAR